MLSEASSVPVVAPGRWLDVRRSLLWPTVRVARLDRVAGTVLLGSIPLLVAVVRNGDDLFGPAAILGVATGASVGWVADDPTLDLLTPCAVNTPRRLACRVLLAVAVAIVFAVAVTGVAAVSGSPSLGWGEGAPVSMFAALVALGGGMAVLRRGDPLGGVTGVTAGLLAPFFVAVLAFRWPDVFPSFGAGPLESRWWILVLGAALFAYRGVRDPATTALHRRARIVGRAEGT